jgi:hypothetical protein
MWDMSLQFTYRHSQWLKLYGTEQYDSWWIMNCKEYRRKQSWPNLRCYLGIYLEGLSKTTGDLNQDSQSSGRDLNPRNLEYEAGLRPIQPRSPTLDGRTILSWLTEKHLKVLTVWGYSSIAAFVNTEMDLWIPWNRDKIVMGDVFCIFCQGYLRVHIGESGSVELLSNHGYCGIRKPHDVVTLIWLVYKSTFSNL